MCADSVRTGTYKNTLFSPGIFLVICTGDMQKNVKKIRSEKTGDMGVLWQDLWKFPLMAAAEHAIEFRLLWPVV
jgi:hypothetical protein